MVLKASNLKRIRQVPHELLPPRAEDEAVLYSAECA